MATAIARELAGARNPRGWRNPARGWRNLENRKEEEFRSNGVAKRVAKRVREGDSEREGQEARHNKPYLNRLWRDRVTGRGGAWMGMINLSVVRFFWKCGDCDRLGWSGAAVARMTHVMDDTCGWWASRWMRLDTTPHSGWDLVHPSALWSSCHELLGTIWHHPCRSLRHIPYLRCGMRVPNGGYRNGKIVDRMVNSLEYMSWWGCAMSWLMFSNRAHPIVWWPPFLDATWLDIMSCTYIHKPKPFVRA